MGILHFLNPHIKSVCEGFEIILWNPEGGFLFETSEQLFNIFAFLFHFSKQLFDIFDRQWFNDYFGFSFKNSSIFFTAK